MTNSFRHIPCHISTSTFLPPEIGFKALWDFFIRRLLNYIIFINSLRLPIYKYYAFVKWQLTLVLLRFILSYLKHLPVFFHQYKSFLLSCDVDDLMRRVEPICLITATHRPWSFQNHLSFGMHELVVPRVLPLFLPLHFPWHHFARRSFQKLLLCPRNYFSFVVI